VHPLWKKGAALGFLVFFGLWVTGSIRGATLFTPVPQPPRWAGSEEVSPRWQQAANNLKQIGLARMPLPLMLERPEVDQIAVHEKTAALASDSGAFDDDVAMIRSALEEHKATVFNERNTGIAPRRQLMLEIGVHPEKFDALVEQLRTIAHLDSVSVQQRDRTGEFRRLRAQRESLKKHLAAVQKLRGANNPSIDDTLKVEQKIQDIEKELQALSVQLGELLGKESFYHVHLTLIENPTAGLDRAAMLPKRVLHALLWALAWWLGCIGTIGVLAATTLSIWTLWPKRG
jgi:hypothetical protein